MQFLSQLGHCVGIGAVVLFGGCCHVLEAGGGVLGACVVRGGGVDCHVLCGGAVVGGGVDCHVLCGGAVVCGAGVDCHVFCGGGVLRGAGAVGTVPVPP
ncbi:hypothetical protein A5686_25355 [Mycobacterium sp. E2479]|nr:hypothetical protein A5686_25355 [Mycobacterium sp. E2479]